MSHNQYCQLLTWDTLFFGYKVAKLTKTICTDKQYDEFIMEVKTHQVRLVYYFVPVEEQLANEFSKRKNFFLTDTKITYSRNISPKEIFPVDQYIYPYESTIPDDVLYRLSLTAGVHSRFKVDSNFKNHEYERLYRKWIEESTNRKIADQIFVYIDNGIKKGLITIRKNKKSGDIGLIAVNANDRGKGIGSKLINAVLQWLKNQKIWEINVVTQKKNMEACKLYEKNGFRISNQQNIYHLWF